MKITFDKEKTKEALSGFMKNTVEFSKKTATNAKAGVANMVEKSKEDSYTRKMKKYNPLFPEQYQSESFKLPNIIMIVDDAVRRGIDVCEGAIGWLNSDTGAEVLYLYDEFVESSGIQFIPKVTCDAVYYVDGFDRNKFIQADCIFNRAHDERLAELKHIAYCLGAKKCTIETTIKDLDIVSKGKTVSASKEDTATLEEDRNSINETSSHRHGQVVIEFKNNATLQHPTLKWFKYDDNIKNLIEIRCNGTATLKTETLKLSGSSFATMSQKAAYALEAVIKGRKMTYSGSITHEASKEHHSTLSLYIEF